MLSEVPAEALQPEPAPIVLLPKTQHFHTLRNIFGLSRKYYGLAPPSHDPDDSITLYDLVQVHTTASGHPGAIEVAVDHREFFPYPNLNSFLLGSWYWNQGVQKSQESFKRLIKIVGDPDFSPGDVCSVKWDDINKCLAGNGSGQAETNPEWLSKDAGWMRTTVSISVPFHRRMAIPGPQRFIVGELYHRSIVAVIRERVSLTSDEGFHYEPYELLWKSADEGAEVRVHGELYTSAAFISEHKKLLDSEPEPGCSATRAIVALMFWSDATQLVTFGNAKLWPCYMYFGNDSKYQRAAPSRRLSHHIAYFQSVRMFLTLQYSLDRSLCLAASGVLQRFCFELHRGQGS